MAAKVRKEAAGGHVGEYNIDTGNSSTGQEWIIDAYRNLEPTVSLLSFSLQLDFGCIDVSQLIVCAHRIHSILYLISYHIKELSTRVYITKLQT